MNNNNSKIFDFITRYKIIKFQAEDAEKEIVNLSDHFTEVTIPAVAGNYYQF